MKILDFISPVIGSILDRVLPDPAQAAAAKLEVIRMEHSGELAELAANTDLMKGQMAINAVEAASASLWVSGWRPFIGWICGAVLGFKYIGGPLLVMGASAVGVTVTPPDIPASELWPILAGLLGLAIPTPAVKVKAVA